jgi:hypothetical protein
MRRWKRDAKTKTMIVIEGLKGKPVAQLCLEHQISQTQCDQWCDQFLTHTAKVLRSMSKTNAKRVWQGRMPS